MADAPNNPTPSTVGTPAFIVAVDDQPSTILVKDANGKDTRIDNFGRWKARGVNTLYRSQKDEPLIQWITRASSAWLSVIPTVPFRADGSVDVELLRQAETWANVIGWTFEDEADRRQAIKPNPPITFARMRQITAQVRAATAKPIYLTFTGGGGGFDNVYYDGSAAGQRSSGGPGHRAPDGWFGLPDVVVWDYHLWATGRPAMWEIHDRMQDRAAEWSGGKPQMVYVESSPQNLEDKHRPGPTAEQYADIIRRRVERAKAKGQNLAGIVIFPQRIGGGFQFDATPDDVAAAMPAIHAELTGQPAPEPAPTPREVELLNEVAYVRQQYADLADKHAALARRLGDARKALGDAIAALGA